MFIPYFLDALMGDVPDGHMKIRRRSSRRLQPYAKPSASSVRQQDAFHHLQEDDQAVRAHLELGQFRPEEVQVRVRDDGRTVVVEAEHQSADQKNGSFYRQYRHQILLPEDVVTKDLKAQFSAQGVLSITAPKRQKKSQNDQVKEIPITFDKVSQS